MSNTSSTPESRHYINSVEPLKVKGKTIDWRTGWAVVLFVPFFLVLFWSFLLGLTVLIIDLGYLLLASLFWLSLVLPKVRDGFRRTPITMWYRKHSHGKRTRKGLNFWTSEEAQIGQVFGITDYERPPPEPPPEVGKIEFYTFLEDPNDPESTRGGAFDHRHNTDSAALWVGGDSPLMQDPEEMLRRLGGYKSLLDHFAARGSVVSTFYWQDVTLVGELSDPKEMGRALARGSGQLPSPELLAGYLGEARKMEVESVVHWTTFGIAIDRGRTEKLAKKVGGPERLLAREAIDLLKFIKGGGDSEMGVVAAGILGYNDRLIDNRLKADPVRGKWIHQQWERPEDADHLIDPRLALPGSFDFEPFDHCVCGSSVVLPYYIEDYPPGGMTPRAFWEVVKVGVPKVLTVVYQMVPSRAALRLQELRTTTERSSNADMAKAGQRVKERHRRSAEMALELEAQLADSAGSLGRVRVYVSVIGRDLDTARSNAEEIESAAVNAPFNLELLTHRMDEGYGAQLNVGRGLEGASVATLLGK